MLDTSSPHSENEQEQQVTVAAIEPDTEQSLHPVPPQKPASWGQFLLPLFFAAMETCWIDAIFIGLANTDALETPYLLFPLWLPFVLIGSFYVFSCYQRWYASDNNQLLAHKGKHISASSGINIFLMAVATLLTIWISYYGAQTAFTDPGWLLNVPSVILQFNSASFRLVGVIVLAIAFCRQGSLLARGRIDDAVIAKMIQSGIFTFIILLVIQKFLEVAGRVFDDGWTILFLMVLYLCLSLATHALARVGVVRRHYSVRQKNDLIRQERVTLQSVILTSSVLLVIALGIGAILNATLIGDTCVLYLKPNSFIVPPLGNNKIPAHCGINCNAPVTQQETVHHVSQQPTNTLLSTILFVLFIILLLAIVVFALILVVKFIRSWRKRERPKQRWELHENLWSWLLFWQQLSSFMHTLLKRFFAFNPSPIHIGAYPPTIDRQAPFMRDIYEIYHTFLKYAANQGYPRKNYETPYEFSIRVAQHFPLLEPHLALITSAFITTRYAGTMLKPEDVSTTHNAWITMRQNWQ